MGGEEWCRRTLGGASRRGLPQPGERACPEISEPLCCLLVADTAHTMKLALLPWILMLLATIPGPRLTTGMPRFALLTPPCSSA